MLCEINFMILIRNVKGVLISIVRTQYVANRLVDDEVGVTPWNLVITQVKEPAQLAIMRVRIPLKDEVEKALFGRIMFR